MKLLLVLCALLANVALVHAETWSVAGTVQAFRIDSLKGRHQIKVRLVQGGAWETTCGEMIVGENGGFSLTCQKPWFSNQAHLYMYHRLYYGEQCRYTKFPNIDPISSGDTWAISEYDDGEASDDLCPHEYY
ncbi:unnamed protein product [Bursaphelenchus xylophilus]|uniref:(pine wood nematode) hypothetical protein n=1 Tax=Bursaphelenchus xylophilus TaxID=6326 RepID=A0A1I7RQQ4_BURXY|nr:unnamed protein product [Bursaphelenchus xylophilus]CAG9104951.1 unnamed protein product [Bursaphelenchus xylophilus]